MWSQFEVDFFLQYDKNTPKDRIKSQVGLYFYKPTGTDNFGCVLTNYLALENNNIKIHYFDVIKHRFTYGSMAQISNLELWWAVRDRSRIWKIHSFN